MYDTILLDCTSICICILQTLMNVLKESVDANSTAPTQCQDTPAPVMLPIPLMQMGMLVTVSTCEWVKLGLCKLAPRAAEQGAKGL